MECSVIYLEVSFIFHFYKTTIIKILCSRNKHANWPIFDRIGMRSNTTNVSYVIIGVIWYINLIKFSTLRLCRKIGRNCASIWLYLFKRWLLYRGFRVKWPSIFYIDFPKTFAQFNCTIVTIDITKSNSCFILTIRIKIFKTCIWIICNVYKILVLEW